MNERCEVCQLFKRLYVPPVKDFDNIPKDAYVCTLIDGEVMYLGQGDNAKNGMCECFKNNDEVSESISTLRNAAFLRTDKDRKKIENAIDTLELATNKQVSCKLIASDETAFIRRM